MTHADEKTERTVPARSSWGWLRQVLPVSFALALTLTFGSADAWARTNVAPPAVPTAEVTPKGAAPEAPSANPAFDGAYAQREAAAPGLEKFEGGDVVIIGSGGLILLLLILILIIEL